MKLHEQVKDMKDRLEFAKQELADLEKYLLSSKFHDDTTVQVKDILNRIVDLKALLN